MKYSKYTRVGAGLKIHLNSVTNFIQITHKNLYHRILHGFIKYAKVITQNKIS